MTTALVITSYNPLLPTTNAKLASLSLLSALRAVADIHVLCIGPFPGPIDKAKMAEQNIKSFTVAETDASTTVGKVAEVFEPAPNLWKTISGLLVHKPDMVVIDGYGPIKLFHNGMLAAVQAKLNKDIPIIYFAHHSGIAEGSTELTKLEEPVLQTSMILGLGPRTWHDFEYAHAKNSQQFLPSVEVKAARPTFTGPILYIGDVFSTTTEKSLAKMVKLADEGQRVIVVARQFVSPTKWCKVVNYTQQITDVMDQCHCAFFPESSKSGVNMWLLACITAGLPVVAHPNALTELDPDYDFSDAYRMLIKEKDLSTVLQLDSVSWAAMAKRSKGFGCYFSHELSVESLKQALSSLK